ncbi:endoplasmic reticulum metallopeptidase 1-like isoform X1 [Cimex lectularius]|uniref:FXNA-like protease n=2 Tax=Cimex lectularius TaxID=79782 RepID=A0A8I6RF09_CIMLE|nr:endoplasmic reticulum metallopeptidase 1-like isoform X1 [Cimex lectularius]XP_014243583.1 endoplasmic reticulum metallopeptidase 1-like isoform X1 [Cimex lectularius]
MDTVLLRYRGSGSKQEVFTEMNEALEASPRKLNVTIKAKRFLIILFLLTMLYVLANNMAKTLPVPLMIKDEITHKNRFIAERAMNHIQNLTSIGARPVGSFANEVLAVNFLYKELDVIMKKAHKIHRISIDQQRASGSFPLLFLDGMTSVYKDIQNIVVKIGPPVQSSHSILVNCHYDTVADSPGGSDDAASCGVMLELLRVISLSSSPLKNNIIFLFNGAEENLLQGSHAFITQHKWAEEVKCFINLEACGAGGKELLFQAGPENPWLFEAYALNVKSSMASTLAEEVFQSGLIPGDTDFRIFRDFGGIPGLDFAWTSNGYVYHTKHDNVAQIPLGTLQHTGDNILPIVLYLANMDLTKEKLETQGKMVYFDFFGTCIIRIKQKTSAFINLLLTMTSIFINYMHSHTFSAIYGHRKKTYFLHTCLCSCVMFFSWLLSVLTAGTIGFMLTTIDRAMSWYATPTWIYFLYAVPSVLVSLVVMSQFSKWQARKLALPSTWNQRLNSDAFNLVLAFIIIVCIVFDIRSGFFAAIWLAFSIVGNLLKDLSYKWFKGDYWLLVYLITFILPFFKGCYMISVVYKIVIPIMGRSGAGNHEEIVMACISSVLTLMIYYFVVPLVVAVDNMQKITNVLISIIAVALLALLLTPLGFPYSADPNNLTPQRYMILHVSSESRDIHGSVTSDKSGFWVVDLDINSPHLVQSFVPEMFSAQLVTDCTNQLYCGLPYIIPVWKLIWKTHWIPAPKPTTFILTELILLDSGKLENNIKRYQFRALGPDHMTLMISPVQGVSIVTTDINKNIVAGPKWRERETYFVYYSSVSNPSTWEFSLDIKISDQLPQSSPVLDIALCGHFIHGANQKSVRLTKLLAQFPRWAVTTGWSATYTSYKF